MDNTLFFYHLLFEEITIQSVLSLLVLLGKFKVSCLLFFTSEFLMVTIKPRAGKFWYLTNSTQRRHRFLFIFLTKVYFAKLLNLVGQSDKYGSILMRGKSCFTGTIFFCGVYIQSRLLTDAWEHLDFLFFLRQSHSGLQLPAIPCRGNTVGQNHIGFI